MFGSMKKRGEYTFEAASFTTYFDSTQINRSINLEIACRYLDYIELQPGDEFPSTWPSAAHRRQGLPQRSHNLGRRLCQLAGRRHLPDHLHPLQRGVACKPRNHPALLPRPHVSYVAPGRDATVYWGTQDFRFKNSYDFPILIRAIYDNEAETVIISVHAKEEFTLPGIFIEVHRGTVTGKWYTNRYADGVLNYTCESKYLS